ncbi:MAG: hypothetical protein JO197_14365 [Acidobacteria bacterium]|nr:hypothetical protein [Acidobacteriota bacterium]MBV9478729.1 hypothetical protein [Acidobacteriota bacterium]
MTSAVDAADLIADLLGRGHEVQFRARGDSMHPLIHGDDLLHVVPAHPASIARGDVVLTRAARGLTAHRVLRIDATTLVTRGDNAPADDPPASFDQLLGRVAFAERDGRRVRVRRARGIALTMLRLTTRVVQRLARR